MIIDHYERSPWRGHDTSIMLPLLLPPHALACNQGALHQHQFHHHPCHDHHHPHLTKGHLAKTRMLLLISNTSLTRTTIWSSTNLHLQGSLVLVYDHEHLQSPNSSPLSSLSHQGPSCQDKGPWSWFSMVIITISITTFRIILLLLILISPRAILPRQGSLVLVLPFDSLRPPFDPQLTASSSSKPKLSVLHKQDTFFKKKLYKWDVFPNRNVSNTQEPLQKKFKKKTWKKNVVECRDRPLLLSNV